MPRRTGSRLLLLTVLPVLVGLTACGQDPSDSAAPEPTALTSDVERIEVALADAAAAPEVVTRADALGLQLINEAPDETTVTSPAGLQVILSMSAEGADGQTLTELEAAIGASGDDRREAVNALTASLAELEGDPAVATADELPDTPIVHRADRVVVDDDLAVNQDFVDGLIRHYGATAATTDLGSDEAKAVLDAWVDEQTGGLVEESGINASPTLRLVLQDAFLLAARWETPFLAALTETDSFTLATGKEVEVEMMTTGREQSMRYAEAQGWQAVRLPYTGGRLHADIVLPPEGFAPTDLTPELLGQLLEQLDGDQFRPVILDMPVVDVSSSLDLLNYLDEQIPASRDIGFTGMADTTLTIEQAVQQGALVIDEEGTVAAVVTEVGFDESGPAEPPIEFRADRPYLVRIGDSTTGWPLVLAHIADPRGEG